MALFKTDPDAKDAKLQHDAEAKLRARRRDRDAVAEQLKAFEAKVIERRAAALALVTDGGLDDPKLTSIETEVRVAEERIRSLTGGLAGIDKDIAGLERTIDLIVDKRSRVETGAAVNAMADRIAKAQAAHATAALELEMAAKEGGILIPESVAVYEFTRSAREQLVPAVEMIVAALKAHSHGVLSGHAPASLPRPAAPPVQLKVVPPVPTLNIFALRNLKFVNDAGGVTCIGGKKRSDVPEALGRLAISSGLALEISDPRCRDIGYNASPYQPDEANCEWLGKPGKDVPPRFMRPGPAPIHSSLTEFTPMDRGGPYKAGFTRPAEPVPMAAARSMPDDEA
jgi:hypothetical protein